MAGVTQKKIEVGSKKYNEMMDELCKEAREFAGDYETKVVIFVRPKPENVKVYSYDFSSGDAMIEETDKMTDDVELKFKHQETESKI